MSLKNREYPRAEISRKAETSLIGGSTWVYDTEVKKIFGEIEDGNLIDVVNNRGRYMGTGYYNSHSKIRIRVISQNANDHFDYSFYERRVRYAWEYRKTVMRDDLNCCRVIFGEADGFPGLTVDKFDDILVTQTLSLGTERVKPLIFKALVKVLAEDGFNIRGIFERNDVGIRRLEGMEENKGFFKLDGLDIPDSTEVTIVENGIKYYVDFENGQKTGFSLTRNLTAERPQNWQRADEFLIALHIQVLLHLTVLMVGQNMFVPLIFLRRQLVLQREMPNLMVLRIR